ncbi:MAG TPA: OB-fold domain-containing protein, partial [Dehalococcoidia bacterium]
MPEAEILSAPYVLEYPYHRSTGPIIAQFLGGLKQRRIFGIRARDGRVIVPPQEYDPASGDAIDEMVEVGQSGVVTTWTWITAQRPNHPLQRPFAFALIRLDGADTAMLHCVDAPEASMQSGMRVRAR